MQAMLKDILISEVRVKMLTLLLKAPNQSLHVRDIVRRRPKGNKVFYDVNTSFVFYPELLSLVCKETGLGADIIKASKDLGKISFAVLSKAFSRGRVAGVLDVDLMIVGSVDAVMLREIIRRAEEEHKHE